MFPGVFCKDEPSALVLFIAQSYGAGLDKRVNHHTFTPGLTADTHEFVVNIVARA